MSGGETADHRPGFPITACTKVRLSLRSWLCEIYGKVEEGKRHWMMLLVCVSAFPVSVYLFPSFFRGGWGEEELFWQLSSHSFFDAFNVSGI